MVTVPPPTSRRGLRRTHKLSLRDNGRLLTPTEFDRHENWNPDYKYELVHGVLIVNPPPDLGQRGPNEELGHWLWDFARQHPGVIDHSIGEQYVSYYDNRRIADRVIWTGLGRLPDPYEDVPSIAIEFVSRSKRDRVRDYETKRDEYLAAGIKEYWVIDRFQRTLTVFKTGPNGVEQLVVPAAEVYRSTLLPGFELPLAKLLAIADLWDKPRRPKPAGEPPGTDPSPPTG